MGTEKVGIPSEPVNPQILYKRDVEGKIYEKSELRELLSGWERDLDAVAEELKTGRFSFVTYQIEAIRTDIDRFAGLFISRGFSYVGDRELMFSIRRFQNSYREEFARFLESEEYVLYPIALSAFVFGALDQISEEVDLYFLEEDGQFKDRI